MCSSDLGDMYTLSTLTANDLSSNAVITTRYRGSTYQMRLNNVSKTQLFSDDFIFKTDVVNDSYTGTSSDDDLFGAFGGDTLSGSDGNDRLFGEEGNDQLFGGFGSDTFYGGGGNDQFVLENFNISFTTDLDVVTDFVRGSDRVDLRTMGIGDMNTLSTLTANDLSSNAVITTRYRGSTYQMQIGRAHV